MTDVSIEESTHPEHDAFLAPELAEMASLILRTRRLEDRARTMDSAEAILAREMAARNDGLATRRAELDRWVDQMRQHVTSSLQSLRSELHRDPSPTQGVAPADEPVESSALKELEERFETDVKAFTSAVAQVKKVRPGHWGLTWFLALGVALVLGVITSSSLVGLIIFVGTPLVWMFMRRAKQAELGGAMSRKLSAMERTAGEWVALVEAWRKVNLEAEQKAAANYISEQRVVCEATLDGQRRAVADELPGLVTEIAAFDSGYVCGGWQGEGWDEWQPPRDSARCVRIGKFRPPMERFHARFGDSQLLDHVSSGGSALLIPAVVDYETGPGVVVEQENAVEDVRAMLQSTVARLLASVSPGGVKFLFIDPVSLGGNVAGFMELDKYDRMLVGGQAWSDARHIEKALSDLTQHMETVIQKYLRERYKTLDAYNRESRVKEPYRVVVVFDFPVNFSDEAAKRLGSIMRNGPRCGVFPIVVVDVSKPLPYGFSLNDLEEYALVIRRDSASGHFVAVNEIANHQYTLDCSTGPVLAGCCLEIDEHPPAQCMSRIITAVGEEAKEAMKVEVPYVELLAHPDLGDPETWWECNHSSRCLEAPLGPFGARDILTMRLDSQLSPHALIVGRPGSGKTNLMHVIITSLAQLYSPVQLQLYLIDFKKGVGFKAYADYGLPHAQVVAIETEREFGLSVLRRLDAEITRRGELFRAAGGVEKLDDYLAWVTANGAKDHDATLPRIVLIADEYQEFFTVDDALSNESKLLLDRVIRQGRGFGLHVILGTQTLAGSYGLPRSTVDLVAIRIALQCSDADSRLILGEGNAEARLLSRPGEAIYNDQTGAVEANKRFQVALFTDDDKKVYVTRAADRAATLPGLQKAIVFEGNEPASLVASQKDPASVNDRLVRLARVGRSQDPRRGVDAWLGEPIEIKEQTSARFRRQAGSNLLVVSRDEEQGIGVLTAALVTLLTQVPEDKAKVILLDYSLADADWRSRFSELSSATGHEFVRIGRTETAQAVQVLLAEVKEREQRAEGWPLSTFLVLTGLQRARELRYENYDYGQQNASEDMAHLLRYGPDVGVHSLVLTDSVASLSRTFDQNRVLREFGMRAAAAMSVDDSSALLDDGAASRIDRPHRMVLYDEEHPGVLEKFRPFAVPPATWIPSYFDRLLKEEL